MSDSDRSTLFENERFLIGMLQAVSGAAVIAALSQWDTLNEHAGRLGVLLFLTGMAVALVLAVCAAYWKHEYKKWDVKAGIREGEATYEKLVHKDREAARAQIREAERQRWKATTYLGMMRTAMLGATILVPGSVVVLVASLWLCTG